MEKLEAKKNAYRHILRCISLFGSVQVLNILIGIVRTKVTAMFLGAYGMGIASVFNSTISLFANSTNMGLPTSGVNAITEEVKMREKSTIIEMICLVRSLCLVAAVAGMLLCILLSPLINCLTFSDGEFILDIIFLSPVIALTTLIGGELAVLKATRQLRNIATASLLGVIASLFISAPIYYIWSERGIIPVIGLMTLVQWLVTLRYSCRKYPLRYSFSLKFLRKGKPLIKLGTAFVAATMLNSLAEFAIRSFLCQAGSIRAVGLFNAAVALSIGYTGLVFSSMDSDYFPRLSAIEGKGDELNDCINRQREINSLLMGVIVVLLIILMPTLIPLLYNTDFEEMTKMAQLAAAGMFFKANYLPLEYLPLAKGKSMVYFCQESLAVLGTFLFEVIGFWIGGLTGLGGGMLAANALELLVVSSFWEHYNDYDQSYESMEYMCEFSIVLVLAIGLMFLPDASEGFGVMIFGMLCAGCIHSYRSLKGKV